jgi:hypothetical protein
MAKATVSLSIAVLLVLGADVAYADKKVVLCHVPPGNPANARTLSVGEAAIGAHLAHGDQLGECPTGCQQNAAACDDGNACTSDSCGPNGQCEHHAVSCDDGNPCTTDVCDGATGCLAVPNPGASCDDGNACTGQDACVGATCHGTSIAGCCATSADCNDGDACTTDACVDGHCANAPRDCTVVDKCVAGFCDVATGACGTTPVSCDDGNVCTDDSCDPVSGCVSQPTTHPPEPSETSCADGADNDCDGLVDAADPDCHACGDGVAQAPEECDSPDFKGQTCETVLGAGATGTLSCSAGCTLVSDCQLCGNGVREGTEDCDGADLPPGVPACQSNCCSVTNPLCPGHD